MELIDIIYLFRDSSGGRERFRTITSSYYRGSMVCYDVTSLPVTVLPNLSFCLLICCMLFSPPTSLPPTCLIPSPSQGLMLIYDITNEDSFKALVEQFIPDMERVSSVMKSGTHAH